MTQSSASDATLGRALELHGAGRLQDAERLYRDILVTDPEHADALHYLGVIGLQVGRAQEAAELIERSLALRPDNVDAAINLANAWNAMGRHVAALNRLEQVLSLDPPARAAVLANLGGTLAQLGRHKQAVERFEQALELEPGLTEARRSLADSLREIGRPNEALKQIQTALRTAPPSLPLQISLANCLHAAGRSEEAVHCFNEILKARPELTPVRGNLASALRQAGRLDDAIAEYERALQQDPQHVESWYHLGLAWQDLGNRTEALKAFRRAVDIDPSCAAGWHGIATVAKNALSDEEVAAMLALQQAETTSDDDRLQLGFALGRYYENAGRHAEAAEQFTRANSLRRRSFDYELAGDLQALRNLERRFDRSFLDRWRDAGLPDRKPIFIVGMPRSGTTLVEQILASHPQVYGGGELTLLPQAIAARFPMPDGIDYSAALHDASVENLQSVARRYLDELPNTDAAHVTDKLPYNYRNLGMIRILFPNAAIVHCRRDPRDTCFSIYKNLFSASGHGYAYDLDELAQYYNAYARLMRHWESVMPGQIHAVQYETLIDDFENSARALLDACGLEWDPACLEFHKLDRPVATISASQVREPIHRGSIGAWQRYEEMLGPLIERLNCVD